MHSNSQLTHFVLRDHFVQVISNGKKGILRRQIRNELITILLMVVNY